jgi:hypothetical protein
MVAFAVAAFGFHMVAKVGGVASRAFMVPGLVISSAEPTPDRLPAGSRIMTVTLAPVTLGLWRIGSVVDDLKPFSCDDQAFFQTVFLLYICRD